jgi:hypothetical protein
MTDLTPWQKYKKNLGDTRPWDIIKPSKQNAPKSVSEERYSICKECPEFIKITSQCKKCGCFMPAKTTLALASCPIGKWEKVENVK